ncbi:MAG: hypothetical protein U0T77_08350 [Chitinophagales bacterium]
MLKYLHDDIDSLPYSNSKGISEWKLVITICNRSFSSLAISFIIALYGVAKHLTINAMMTITDNQTVLAEERPSTGGKNTSAPIRANGIADSARKVLRFPNDRSVAQAAYNRLHKSTDDVSDS